MQPFTVEQVRAARAFLGWRQVDLGEASGLSFETIPQLRNESVSSVGREYCRNAKGVQESWCRISQARQADRRHDSCSSTTLVNSMTGDQSRLLKVGDRVCWGATTTDLGTVVRTSWSEVTIDWDDGHTSTIQHNDMAQVERVPTKIM